MKNIFLTVPAILLSLSLIGCGSNDNNDSSEITEPPSDEILSDLQSKQRPKVQEAILNVFGSYESFENLGIIYTDLDKGKIVIGFENANENMVKEFKGLISESLPKNRFEFTQVEYTTAELQKVKENILKDIEGLKINPDKSGKRQAMELGVDVSEQKLHLKLQHITEQKQEKLTEKYSNVLTVDLFEEGEAPTIE